MSPNGPCLGVRKVLPNGERGEYFWQSYSTVQKRMHNFSSGLLNYGVKSGDFLGIFSINCAEWVIAELATYAQSVIPISLYDTLGPEAVAFIINQTELNVVVASKDKIPSLIQAGKMAPSLKVIIQLEREGDKAIQEQAQAAGIKLLSFSEVEDNGAFQAHDLNPAKANDLATIMYTSGTTGDPKGVMLTHFNIISMLAGASAAGLSVTPNDVHISYLPLAHIFERVVMAAVLCEGGSVGFYQGMGKARD